MHEANVNPIRSSMHFMYILRARFVYTFRINNEQPGNSSAPPPLKRSSWIILGSQIELRFLSSNLHVSKIPRIVRVSQASRNQPRADENWGGEGKYVIRQRSVKRKRRHVPLANETRRNAWNFGKMRTCFVYVPDLTFDPCVRGESGGKGGKGETRKRTADGTVLCRPYVGFSCRWDCTRCIKRC